MRKFIVCAALLLAGCGAGSRIDANFTGYDKKCVDGVVYLQFPSGATVQVDREGRPVPCEGTP